MKQLQLRVLQVLEARNIPHEVRDIATDKAAKRDFRLYMRTDKASTPQIFHKDLYCGVCIIVIDSISIVYSLLVMKHDAVKKPMAGLLR